MESINKIKEGQNPQIEELSPLDLIRKLQHNSENIRNICVLAHVDHGKTSLVDSLISYNNIINPRLAGDLRYMDSRPDEQERCITMKSSSISITYESELFNDAYLINVIDSPGHVDFSSEIFSALKICDGAIIVIDVVEGVCSQTESVIKQAWDEKIKCVLVLNKIDRLISEIQLEPLEAYFHLNNLLEKVNSLMGSLIVRDINIKTGYDLNKNEKQEEGEIDIEKLIEEKENELYFSPDKGNVIFASAIDNWGFTLNTFSEILSKKIGFKKEAIQKMLWGDFFFNNKSKKVYRDRELANTNKPMFVEFVLDNIYKLYKMILIEKNPEKIQKAANSINVQITAKELTSLERNAKTVLKNIFRQWLPISPTIFDVAIQHLPNPITGCRNKLDVLFPPYKISYQDFPIISSLKDFLDKKISKESEEVPTIAFISKMVPISRKNISGEVFNYNTVKEMENKDEVRFMAFARNYCGTFKRGQEFFVIGPKHDPKSNIYDIQKFKFDKLYFFMGQHLEEINEVPLGNIFSIGGLENYVYKTATISSVFDCPSIIPSNINKNSIIKVSITSEDLKDMSKLIEGLRKLYKSDPAVDYYVQSNGEHILVTAGEVHLERCLKDLEDGLAKVKVKTSPPIVNFKEGLANKNYQLRRKNEKEGKGDKEEKLFEIKEKERKKDLNAKYTIEEGEKNIDTDNQKEILKSCTPYILVKEPIKKKTDEKVVIYKVKDIKSIKEKTNSYIEKNVRLYEKSTDKGYAEDTTPNELCKIGVSAVGMTDELVEFIDKNEKFLKEIDNRDFVLNKELFDSFLLFKESLLNKIENKKLKNLVENNLVCFGLNNCGPNMLIIKNISKMSNYFSRVRLEGEQDKIDSMEEIVTHTNISTSISANITTNISSNEDVSENIFSNKDGTIDIDNKSSSNKSSQVSGYSKTKSNKLGSSTKNTLGNNQSSNEHSLEDEVSRNLKNAVTPREFINSIKSGFDLAVSSSPLCEENMYGVIFVVEEITFNKPSKENDEQQIEAANELVNKQEIDSELKEENKSEDHSLSSKKFNIFGPFLGQLIGTVKDVFRKAFLSGEPRLYEAIYLCLFQIRQEHVGKIHSVISRRRGTIINELSNDDSTTCTIEAVVPVVESFGFVEEIRKNTSGMANPMLQFYKWQMIDVDPFYVPITQEVLDNFGANNDAPNLAKNYINKVRIRKGLPIDEKIVKNADKQINLSRKR